jgi:RHS repeat-associated protein
VTSSSGTYNLYYDALGRCVKRTLNGLTTYYIYDGEKPILEYNPSGAIIGRNVYGKGIDEILMRTAGSQTYYFQDDHEGSVTHLTSAAGAVIEKYKYDAFGAVTMYNGSGAQIATSAYGNRFLFTGREYASTFSFYEYRARAYNTTLGRFMSEDPRGFDAGDYNLFRYCHNDPLDLADPMGLAGNGPDDNPAISHAAVSKAIDRAYNQMMSQIQRQMRFSGGIGIGMTGYQAWSALGGLMKGQANAALDPTHIRVVRNSNDLYGTMLGEMWHTDDHGNIIGGVDTFRANMGTNTPASDPSKGFYSRNGPLPPGNYEIKGREASQVTSGAHFGAGWPAITSPGLPPGRIYAPGGQIRSALLIHGYGISNGCLGFPNYALQNVFGAMAAGPVYLNMREAAVPGW